MKIDHDFRQQVAAMRQAQKQWFATKNRPYLILAKQLEKEVDAELDNPRRDRFNEMDPDDHS